MGFEQASPIQAQSIPVALEGKDMIGQAQTGTGKTAAFGIPLLQGIDPHNKKIQAVVLCPTRELAIQCANEMRKFAKFLHGIKVLPIYGGQDIAAPVRYPLLDGKHSPMIGAALGYGIGLSKEYLGGIFSSVDVAYRYEVNNKSSLYVGLNLQFQQAKIPTNETITITNEDNTQQSYDFRDTQGRSFLIPAASPKALASRSRERAW